MFRFLGFWTKAVLLFWLAAFLFAEYNGADPSWRDFAITEGALLVLAVVFSPELWGWCDRGRARRARPSSERG